MGWRDDPIVDEVIKKSNKSKEIKPWERYQSTSTVRYEVTAPNGKKYEVTAPRGATQQVAIEYVKNNVYQEPPKAKPWERYQDTSQGNNKPNYFDKFDEAPRGNYFDQFDETKPDQYTDPTADMTTTQKVLAGVGKGMTDLARGAGQMLGVVSEEDIKRARELDAPLMKTTAGKVGNFAGQAVPAMLIPGVNSYVGASLVGGGLGALQPTVKGESRALNTGFGALGGVIGQKVGNVASNAITKKVANNALLKAQNATRDATLQASSKAGFKVPRSLYNPSVLSNSLESFGGKAATLQEASAHNQKIINNITRNALGLPDNTPLSTGTLDKVRQQAYKPYQEVAGISKGAKNALEALKQAKSDANAWFNSYNRSANPEHLIKAKDFQETADIAESVLEDYAKQANKPELVKELMKARQTIAKTYTVERAMNKGTGDIDARVLGRLYDKNKPLSDGLDVIGRFRTSFPKAAQPTQQSAGAGISALEPISSAAYGLAGSIATGSPTGFLAAGIPLLRSPVRSLVLSKAMQKVPSYGGGVLNLANTTSPLLPYLGARTGGLLSANYD
jgi:hypothetical protein